MNKKIYKTIKILFLSTVFALLAPANGYALPIRNDAVTGFSIEAKFKITTTTTAGIVFSVADENKFLVWQTSISDGNLVFIPYRVTDGTPASLLQEAATSITITNGSTSQDAVHTIRIEVEKNEATTVIDGVMVDSARTLTDENYLFGKLGFQAKGTGDALFDDIRVTAYTASDTITTFETDFSGNYIPFSNSTLEDGWLKVTAPDNGTTYAWQKAYEITWWTSENDSINWDGETALDTTTAVIPDNSVLSLSANVEVGKIWLGTNVQINSGNHTLTAGEVRIDFIVEEDHKWYSIGFPFPINRIDAEEWGEYLTPANGNEANFWLEKYDGAGNKFVPVTALPLEADTGYIIQFPTGYAGKRITFVSDSVNHTNGEIVPTSDTYQLRANPTLGEYELTPENNKHYYTYFGGDDNKYKLASEVVTLKPFEAAITVGAISTLRSSIGDGSNGLTGIEGATIETNDPVIATRYYTVQGAEIKQPSGNGIYIVRKIHASQKEDVSKIIYIKK